MKNLLASALLSVSCSFAATASTLPASGDTLVVKLNNKEKMMVIVEKGNNLANIKAIDFNMIVRDLDSTLKNQQQLYTTDANGNKVLKDTSIVMNGKSSKQTGMQIRTSMGRGIAVTISGEPMVVTKKDSAAKEQPRHRRRTTDDFELLLGFNNFTQKTQGKPYDLNPFGSRYVALNWHYRTRIGGDNSKFYLKYGLEVAWNNYMFEDKFRIVKNDSASFVSGVDNSNSNAKIRKSKLTTTFLNAPIELQFKKKNFRASVGGFVGYRLGSYSKVVYSVDGDTKKDRDYSNFFLNNWQYGLRATVGVKHVDFFVNYHLSNLFTDKKGPELTPFSFGIKLLSM